MTSRILPRSLPVFLFLATMGASLVALALDDAKKPLKDAPSALGFEPVIVVQIAVKDLDRSIAFYKDVLGLKLDYKVAELKWAKFSTAVRGFTIGIGENASAKGSGSTSLNLAVNDTDAARALLEKKGVKFKGETTDIPGVVRLADFDDPDGNRIRLAGPSKQR